MVAVEVQNNLQADPTVYSKEKIISEGMRNITAQATVFSETGSHTAAVEHLGAVGSDIVWTMAGGTITLPDAVLTSPGPRTYEKEQATMRRDNTFTSAGITITP